MDSAVLVTFESLREEVDPIRRPFRLGGSHGVSLADAIPPHMTLTSPAHPDPTGPEASNLLQTSVRGLKSFLVHFTEVRAFPRGTVYLSPDPSHDLETLRSRMHDSFARYGGVPSDYVWHLTVARSGGDRLAHRVRATFEPLSATVGEVSLWTQETPSGPWTCRSRAQLE